MPIKYTENSEFDSKVRARFDKHINRTEIDGCWIWIASRDRFGYGMFTYKNKTWRSHRFSYALAHGEISTGMGVLHRCDNPACVNPAHLFLGTHQDNMDDMFTKGRRLAAHGERSGTSKLTRSQAKEIRERYVKGASRKLAMEYGVSRGAVLLIANGCTWKEVA